MGMDGRRGFAPLMLITRDCDYDCDCDYYCRLLL